MVLKITRMEVLFMMRVNDAIGGYGDAGDSHSERRRGFPLLTM
jgi:hypothetical protein